MRTGFWSEQERILQLELRNWSGNGKREEKLRALHACEDAVIRKIDIAEVSGSDVVA